MNDLKVEEIIFNSKEGDDEVSLKLSPDQIVVFVGPNNAGKSQVLKDIYAQLAGEESHIVVKAIKSSELNGESLLEDIAPFSILNGINYTGLDFSINKYKIDEFRRNNKVFEGIRDFYCKSIKTEDRLLLANPPSQIAPDEIRKHPIHYLTGSEELLKGISDSFHQVFNEILQLDNYAGNKIPLRLGAPIVVTKEMEGRRADLIVLELRKKYQECPSLENQGDGMRSMAGIMLYLQVPHYTSFFIDEPESFLHPPQALSMGKILGSNSKGKQLFIATHSEMLLKGLLEEATDRVKVVRITRENDQNFVHFIGKEKIETIWRDPLLKYSNIMDSLFYPAVVVCESNADCMFYRMILDFINQERGKLTDVMFVECSGKQRMYIVCQALRSLNVDFRAVPDLDLLRKEDQANTLYEACGGNWDADCKADWVLADSSLEENEKELNKADVMKRLQEKLALIPDGNLSKHDIDNIKEALKGKNKWDGAKHNGLDFFEDAGAREAVERLLERFREKGVYIVPFGEMEDLVSDVKGHGKEWLEDVIIKHPDLNDPVFDKAKDYIKSFGL